MKSSTLLFFPPALKKSILLIVWIFLVITLFCTEATSSELRKILVLHSYHKGLRWTDSITEGIEETLNRSGNRVDLHYEYMDTKRVFSKKHIENLIRLFEEKYSHTRFDAVLLSDDHAYQLLLKIHGRVFPSTPVIFCGVNKFGDSDIAENKWFTGVVESLSFSETLSAALQLEPQIDTIYAVMDDTVTGHNNKQLLQNAIDTTFPGKLEPIFLENKTMTELEHFVSNLPEESILAYLNFTTDAAGNQFSHKESAARITSVANRPMYTFWDFHLGSGTIGGKVTSGYSQGEVAANLAIQVLDGISPWDLAVARQSPNSYLFDHRALRRFGFQEEALPSESSILYKPSSFYAKYREVIVEFAVVIVFLLLVISIISFNFLKLRLADRSLKKSEQRFRQLTEMLPETIYEVNLDQYCTFLNRSGIEKFQFDEEQINQGFPIRKLIHSKDHGKLEIRLQLIAMGHVVGMQEYVGIRKDGEEFPIIAHSSPIWEEGQIIGVRGILIDISEIRNLKEQVYRAQRLESVGTLAGGVAHDFNNLLSGIQGHASLAMIKSPAEGVVQEHLTGIETCVQSASHLTKQLLGFARSGRYDVQLSDINMLIEKTVDLFSRTRKDVQIIYSLEPEVWGVEVDRNQMEQVLLNLFINSWQAMGESGTIAIQTENVASTDQVRIIVSDNGPGISTEIKDKIFDPFFTTKERGRGTGLGLASAYGIIDNHKGAIQVVSEPDEGAVFQIDLPAIKERVELDSVLQAEVVEGKGTIMLIDDEAMILDVLKSMISQLGYTVYTARSGMDALSRLKELKERIDLIILDMVMPEMSGAETFHALRSFNPELRILLSSGYSADSQAAELIEEGCNGFIQKPFDLSTISQKIHSIISD